MIQRLIVIVILPLMILPATLFAQKNAGSEFMFTIAGALPPDSSGLPAIGLAGSVTGLHHQHLLIAGGANYPDKMPWEGGKKKYHASITVYTFSKGKVLSILKKFSLSSSLAYAATCTTPSGVFFAGGENEQGIYSQAALLQWDEKNMAIHIQSLPNLPIAITNASATLLNQTVYVAGGETVTGVSNKIFCLNLSQTSAGWIQLPDLPHPVSHAVLIAAEIDKQPTLFLCGGRMKTPAGISTLYNEVYTYQITRKVWTPTTPLPTPLSAGTGFFLPPYDLVLISGDQGKLFHQTEVWLDAIRNEKNDSLKQQLIYQKNQLQQTHPGFSKEVLIASMPTLQWRVRQTIPFPAPVTTSLVPVAAGFLLPSGEIRPGVRSPYILYLTLTQSSH